MWSELLKKYGFVGKAVVIWCARYTYRGILAEVGEECLVLKQPWMIEIAAMANGEKAQAEDRLFSDLVINLGAIEQVQITRWAGHEIDQ